MAYHVYVCKVKNIRPAENADRLNLCEVFGNTTVVDKSVNENDLYIYFPVDGQISEDFGKANKLFREKDANGKNIGGFIEPDKRNIKAIKLRGNRSDGLVLPLKALESFGDISTLKEGDRVEVFNGHEIAIKYVPVVKVSGDASGVNRIRKTKVNIAPLFKEHADTEQLAYNLGAFKDGDQIEITLKMHGTSQRTGYLPVLKGYKRTFWDKICRREGTPIYDWDYITGTRRTVLDNPENGGFYGSNVFREEHANTFRGKLFKGETVYYEVVGFTDTGMPIMPEASNGKLGSDFVKKYGEKTTFSYGCAKEGNQIVLGVDNEGTFGIEVPKPQSDFYVYRMTMTNEDGDVVEYTPDYMRYRCEQMGVKTVPVFWKGYVHSKSSFDNPDSVGESIMERAEAFCDGTDPVGKTHVREGVVVRIVNRPSFTAYKHKNFSFKVLSGIAIEAAEKDGTNTSEDIASEM